jgi:hypothetical protein
MMKYRAINKTSDNDLPTLYCHLSLVELARRIAEASDRKALEEFHNNRTVFCYRKGAYLRFIDYLNELRQSALKMQWHSHSSFEIADKAFDLTLDKFNNLPSETRSNASEGGKISHIVKQEGSNCRLYFKAFVDRANKSFSEKPPTGELEQEDRASKVMQGIVRRHFYFSLREAKRNSNPFWSRYYWNLNNHNICVWLPVSLRGRKRREWLEQNIDSPDPNRSGECYRIQEIINQKLVRERFVPINEAIALENSKNPSPWPCREETFGVSLAKVIAAEKAINIQQQRPSIRALGGEKLKKMILTIFEDISYDDYKDSRISKDFGIAKASFCRFAGSRWQQTKSSIPDLWRNTAQILKDHHSFRQVAKEMGFWDQVITTVEKSASLNKKVKQS